jgi:hypothetical protein
MLRLVLALAVLLAFAPAAQAGQLIDRAAEELRSSNVYVDPDAEAQLDADQVEALQDRITSERAGPMFVAVMPEAISDEAGGDPARALVDVANAVGRDGTYVLVAGRTLRAASNVLDRGVAGELATEAIDDGGSDLDAILLGLADGVGEARENGGSPPGDGIGGSGGLILLGLAGAGGAAIMISRRNRRRRDDAEFQEAKTNARDDLVALGDDIRALDLDASMPDADPQARADYDHAVARYTEAEEQWERARRPQELAPVGEALEEGRWAMASAKARFSGETPPERRPPCFFDPRHGPSTRDVTWSPPYGEPRMVPACEADALRVEEGIDPQPREVEWHGQRVPYWQAGPAYAPFAGGFFGGFGGGLFPGLLIGSMLGSAWGAPMAYGDYGGHGGDPGGGDFGGGGDWGGGLSGGDFGGDFGGGGFGGGGDF